MNERAADAKRGNVWKRVVAVIAVVTVVSVGAIAAAGWLEDRHSENAKTELLSAAAAFEDGIPEGGSMRYEYDGITFDDEGWRGADDSLTSVRTSADGTMTIICDSVAKGAERTCFTRYLTRADDGYVPDKWLPGADLMLTVGGMTPASTAKHEVSNPLGTWVREGDTFTMTIDWPDASERASYTFVGDEVTMQSTYTPDDGSAPLESRHAWTYDAEPHLFEQPSPDAVYTDAESEVERARMDTVEPQ